MSASALCALAGEISSCSDAPVFPDQCISGASELLLALAMDGWILSRSPSHTQFGCTKGLLGHSESTPAASSEDTQAGSDQTGVVKWYNGTKGFGFVTTASGEDAFLHRSVMQQAGYDELPEGARVRIRVVSGPKGPTVSAIARL